MKLVIKPDIPELGRDLCSPKFAWVLSELLAEGHRIVVVHGGVDEQTAAMHSLREIAQNGYETPAGVFSPADVELMVLCGAINKRLVAALSVPRVAAMGICGVDGSLIRLRRNGGQGKEGAEIASVDPFWLDTITQQGAIPVVANIAVDSDRQYCCVDSDRLAAACASAWNADALIFLTDSEGVKGDEGTILRWLESDKIGTMVDDSSIPPRILSKLRACHSALQSGVHRTRIFPLSRLEKLSLFYSVRLEAGTEVIRTI